MKLARTVKAEQNSRTKPLNRSHGGQSIPGVLKVTCYSRISLKLLLEESQQTKNFDKNAFDESTCERINTNCLLSSKKLFDLG